VEKFADIRPERVRLAGPAGTLLAVEVAIVPRADYPFTINRIQARRGEFITYQLVQRSGDGLRDWSIRIENTRQEPGRYVDTVYLHTDSALRPTIPIHVTGIIQ
jgi:hypothetical protein